MVEILVAINASPMASQRKLLPARKYVPTAPGLTFFSVADTHPHPYGEYAQHIANTKYEVC